MNIRLIFSAALLALTANSDAASYDLSTDWSDTINPNSTWSYLVDGDVASAGGARSGDVFHAPGAPPIWGTSFLGWSQDNGSADYFLDLQPGDVYGHSGVVAIDWTSPAAGFVDVVGSAWQLRNIGRSNDWQVLLGDTLLVSGTISSGDGHSRAFPNSFSFMNLPVLPGEVLEFRAFGHQTFVGDYLGVALAVSTRPVPLPSGFWGLVSALGALGYLRRRSVL